MSYKTVARKSAAQGDCRCPTLLRHMQGSFQGSGWQRWLEVSAAVQDCKLASHARRATLNLQSARTVATAEVMPSPHLRGNSPSSIPLSVLLPSVKAGNAMPSTGN